MTPGSPLPSPLCLSLTSRSPVAKTSICLGWKDHNWLPVWFLLLKHHTSPSLNEERVLEKHLTHSGGGGAGWSVQSSPLVSAASTQVLQEGQQDTMLGISDPHTLRAWLPCRKINGDNCGSPWGLGGGGECCDSDQGASFFLYLHTFKPSVEILPSEESFKRL